jgi:hypothetical protein
VVKKADETAGIVKAMPETKFLACGLVMPISAIDGCNPDHWADVKAILTDAVEGIASPRFRVKMVSDADDVGVIQKRIVENVYGADIVVCDVSGRNPNVMFELGMRLAFDKPTVIVTDDKTDYAFDTGVIEHLSYPRDLRFGKIVDFKALLADKVLATYRASKGSGNASFLKSFGRFRVANLEETTVPADKMVVEMLSEMQLEMERMRRAMSQRGSLRSPKSSQGLARVMDQLARFSAEHPQETLPLLLEDEGWCREMEDRCDAPHYFRDPDDFRDALAEAVIRLGRARDS